MEGIFVHLHAFWKKRSKNPDAFLKKRGKNPGAFWKKRGKVKI
jgi:hypothetical protein